MALSLIDIKDYKRDCSFEFINEQYMMLLLSIVTCNVVERPRDKFPLNSSHD